MAGGQSQPQKWGDYMNKAKIIVVIVTIITVLVLKSKIAA